MCGWRADCSQGHILTVAWSPWHRDERISLAKVVRTSTGVSALGLPGLLWVKRVRFAERGFSNTSINMGCRNPQTQGSTEAEVSAWSLSIAWTHYFWLLPPTAEGLWASCSWRAWICAQLRFCLRHALPFFVKWPPCLPQVFLLTPIAVSCCSGAFRGPAFFCEQLCGHVPLSSVTLALSPRPQVPEVFSSFTIAI